MKTYAIIILFLLAFSLSAVSVTPRSVPFADSYLLRAKGSDALYWNPANLSKETGTFDIPFTGFLFRMENNAVNIDTYNRINGQYLDAELKDEFLSGIHDELQVTGTMHSTIIGTSFNRYGLGLGVTATGYGKLSEDYLHLLLYGNQAGEIYRFTKKNNDAKGLLYSDFTFGAGSFDVTHMIPGLRGRGIPPVYVGTSISLLSGFRGYDVESYSGLFSTGDEGINIQQHIILREGRNGIGFKGMIGLQSEPISHLQVGLAFDNLLGNISWTGDNKRHFLDVEADSLYVVDLDEDIFAQTDTTRSTGKFSTRLPVEVNMGLLYRFPKVSLSLDWRQGTATSAITSKRARVSAGIEYLPVRKLALQAGYSSGNAMETYRFSYGLALRTKGVEFGFGLQSAHALVPSNFSKGVTLATHMRLLY